MAWLSSLNFIEKLTKRNYDSNSILYYFRVEQNSPPQSGLSPPFGPHLLGKYDRDDFPLRKTGRFNTTLFLWHHVDFIMFCRCLFIYFYTCSHFNFIHLMKQTKKLSTSLTYITWRENGGISDYHWILNK